MFTNNRLKRISLFVLICIAQWSLSAPLGHLPELGNVPDRIKKIRETLQQAPQTSASTFFGSSTSDHQVAGGNDNNTHYLFERAQNPHYSHIREQAGRACDQPNHLNDDIAAMKQMGLSSHRFSIEWAKVEPSQGVWDTNAIEYYRTFVTKLKEHGIEPIVTLHHYTDPIWFALKGGFANEDNIALFGQYACKMAEELPEVTYWATFNSPAGYTARMYMTAAGPPTDLRFIPEAKRQAYTLSRQFRDNEHAANVLLDEIRAYEPTKTNIPQTAAVLTNVIQAHVAAAQAIHAITDNRGKVGLLQNIHQLDPLHWYDPLAHLARQINEELNHRSIHRAFTSGTFSVSIPLPWPGKYCMLSKAIAGASESLDWIGLNYYSHRWMKGTQAVWVENEPLTSNPNYSIYPEGIYRALHQLNDEVAQPLGIPIIITENGIATDDDELRARFVLAYLEQIARAISEGIPVQRWCPWSLLDNYEWGTKGDKNYGLLAVDWDTLKRSLKPIAQIMQQLSAV